MIRVKPGHSLFQLTHIKQGPSVETLPSLLRLSLSVQRRVVKDGVDKQVEVR